MPDNLALLDKSDNIPNTDSAETEADCGCPFKKAATPETVSNAQSIDSILNPGGKDTLQPSVTQDFLNGNTGNDFISDSADGDMGRSLSQVGGGSLSSDGSAYILTEGSDRFTIAIGLLDTLIGGLRGLGGADSITGSESGDIVYSDEGDDRIEGLGGADLLYGGAGNDFLSGGTGQNGLLGGDGEDTLQGGESADGVNGNAGDDIIFGAGGDDFLRGGRGNDIVNGEDGDDFVIGDFGNDTLTGGAGQDVFFLRYEEALGSPTFDLITDYQKTIDFIGLSTNLRESDIVLESKVQPSGGSAVDIKVAATGTLLGTVLGVTPDDLRGRFRPYDVEPDRPEDLATLDLPEVKKLSDTKFQMEFPASDGSKYIIVFQDDADGRFVESVIFVPNPITGVSGSTTRMSRDGTSADVTVEGSNETLRVENQPSKEPGKPEQGVISRLKDGQIVDKVNFPLPIEPPPVSTPVQPKPTTPPPVAGPDFAKACKSLTDFCEKNEKVAKVLDVFAAVSALGGLAFPPLEVVAAGLKGISNALTVVNYCCTILTGNDTQLLLRVFDTVIDKKFEKAEEFKDLAKVTAKRIDVGKSISRLFVGLKMPQENTLKTNFLPQFRKFLADNTGIPFDACDKPATTPEPAPTCSERDFEAEITPSVLNYGQAAEVKVTYCDPKNEIDNLHIFLGNGKTKDIPVSSSSGTISFGIRNKPNSFGDCDDLGFAADGRLGRSEYLVVSGTSKGRELAQMSNLLDFHLTGGLNQIVTQFKSSGLCDVEFI
ncbi:calcium-binding protein [Kamptonema sp. UHCC 0994]|uniref:calcium-binding protein n=1 Tax=Kamptonema sp. UHCC 0994 TaxID=3031329 RepID=UPI0023B8D8C4|nr:calcium-binding protein [Kamptonema sp. UHCC 0994]MDF0552088.1 calcium-binding protein [Kamptonema sp. UHCC 0994]